MDDYVNIINYIKDDISTQEKIYKYLPNTPLEPKIMENVTISISEYKELCSRRSNNEFDMIHNRIEQLLKTLGLLQGTLDMCVNNIECAMNSGQYFAVTKMPGKMKEILKESKDMTDNTI